MVLLETKLEELREQPIIKSKVWKTQDGNYLVFETVIRTMKHVNYMDKVMTSSPESFERSEEAF